MADSPPYPDSTGTPRWVKVFGIIALILVLLVGIALLIGPGDHGPGRHAPSGDVDGPAPSSSLTESGVAGGHTAPAGGHQP